MHVVGEWALTSSPQRFALVSTTAQVMRLTRRQDQALWFCGLQDCVCLGSLKLSFILLENLAADNSFLCESCWLHFCGSGTLSCYVRTIPKGKTVLMLCCLLDSTVETEILESSECNGYQWPCCVKLPRNKHLLSGCSFGQYSLKIRKSLGPLPGRHRLCLVSFDGEINESAEYAKSNWILQAKDFGLAAKWSPGYWGSKSLGGGWSPEKSEQSCTAASQGDTKAVPWVTVLLSVSVPGHSS